MNNLQLRIVSAVVLAAAVLTLAWLGGLPFRLLAAAMGAAMFHEWCAMTRTLATRLHQAVAAGLLAVVLVVILAGADAAWVFGLLAAGVLLVAADAWRSGQSSWTTAGLAYAGLSAAVLALLREEGAEGLLAILFLFGVVWASDIMAYVVGRTVGGPKLAPRISPGKTRSGAAGGAVGGVAAGLAIGWLAGAANLPVLAATALLLSLISQAGDLFESWVKRRHGVKDSGVLIPGHGGVMDRVDALVAAALALYVIGWLWGGSDTPAQGLFLIPSRGVTDSPALG